MTWNEICRVCGRSDGSLSANYVNNGGRGLLDAGLEFEFEIKENTLSSIISKNTSIASNNTIKEKDASRTRLVPNKYLKTVYVGRVDNGVCVDSEIIPTIEDVKVYAEKSVKVFFSDGTFEQATISGGDTFNLENGISICLTKKILSQKVGEKNGSSVYNKLIDYAVKVERKNREAERKAAEEKAIHDRKIKKAIEKKKKRREKCEQRERAEYISALAEAIKLANEK